MFYKESRGRNYFRTGKDEGRYLSAGFHNVMGYFRDDQPLYELLLDKEQQATLDEMWREMDFVASINIRTSIRITIAIPVGVNLLVMASLPLRIAAKRCNIAYCYCRCTSDN